jgi:microcystin-dependent protein
MFAFPWLPQGWRFCDGSTLSVHQHPILYQLIGNTFGGDDDYFNLPDLRNKVIIGRGPEYPAFTMGGEETHELTVPEMPKHRHQAIASANGSDSATPKDHFWPSDAGYVTQSNGNMSNQATEPAGSGIAHSNMSPYLAINYAMSLWGDYPDDTYRVQDDFIGTIRAFPKKLRAGWWVPCDGTILLVETHRSLFLEIGATYGGNGETTFALPDLRGRSTVNCGEPKGLSHYKLAEKGGEASVKLTVAEMPRHSHLPLAAAKATTSSPAGQVWANEDLRPPINGFAGAKGAGEIMNPAAIGEAGEDAPHNNMMPYLTMEYMIAAGGDRPLSSDETRDSNINP